MEGDRKKKLKNASCLGNKKNDKVVSERVIYFRNNDGRDRSISDVNKKKITNRLRTVYNFLLMFGKYVPRFKLVSMKKKNISRLVNNNNKCQISSRTDHLLWKERTLVRPFVNDDDKENLVKKKKKFRYIIKKAMTK